MEGLLDEKKINEDRAKLELILDAEMHKENKQNKKRKEIMFMSLANRILKSQVERELESIDMISQGEKGRKRRCKDARRMAPCIELSNRYHK